MSTSRPFAYNPTLVPISGAIQVLNSPLVLGGTDQDYTLMPGGVQWWNGPDEELGYVITHSVPTGKQPNPVGIPCYVGFWRSSRLSQSSFVEKASFVSNKTYKFGDEAYVWMNGLGYWSSWSVSPGSLKFSGDSDFKVSSNNINLDNTFTIEFFYFGNPTITGTDQGIFVQGTNPNDINLRINSEGQIEMNGYRISTVLPFNTWVHVAIVCNFGSIIVYFHGFDKTYSGGIPFVTLNNVTDDIFVGSVLGGSKFLVALLTNIRFTTSVVYSNPGFNPPKGPTLPIQDYNPYGGNDTNAISDEQTKLLFDALSFTSFDKDLSNLNNSGSNTTVIYDTTSPF